mgnify:CR=1 FL=1
MVVYISGYLVRRAEQVREQWSGFVIPLGLTFCFLVLLLLERLFVLLLDLDTRLPRRGFFPVNLHVLDIIII